MPPDIPLQPVLASPRTPVPNYALIYTQLEVNRLMRQRPLAAWDTQVERLPKSYTSQHGVTLHIDVKDFDFHVDAPLDFKPDQLVKVLAQARRWGLEPLDPDDECDAEILDDGTTRIWLSPVVPEPAWVTQLDTAEASRSRDEPKGISRLPPTGLLAIPLIVQALSLLPYLTNAVMS